MKIIKNKRIGKVLLIVEGEKHEFTLIKRIFVNVLGYTQIEKRRGSAEYYKIKGNEHNVVAVVNPRTSNIASINDEEYLDTIFAELIEQYDFDINNAAIYYLFDRDPESNIDKKLIMNLIQRLKNSRDNGDYMRGGMLILSYPSIEAYEIENFMDESYEYKARLGKELKKYIRDNAQSISMNKICEDSIVHAGIEMKNFLERNDIEINFDYFSKMNEAVFEYQEQKLNEENAFRILSMLSCVFLDLGIMEAFGK